MKDYRINTAMDKTAPISYGGSFMALLTALDMRPTGAMSGLAALEPDIVDSTTMDIGPTGMDDVAPSTAGNNSTTNTLQLDMGVGGLDVPGSSTMLADISGPYDNGDGFRTPKKSPRAPTPVRISNWFNLLFTMN